MPQLTALDVNPFYPALSGWLARAVQGNAWAEMLAGAVGGTDVLLDAMEEIATTLDAANPLRLDGKRKVLRRDADSANLLNMRLELLLAYRLVTASVYFEFGGQGQPDLICDVPGGKRVWVEVTSRSRSMRDFRDSSALGKHFDAVHRELVNVLNIKKEQAERDGFDPMTLLVVDASRLGISWVRPQRVWSASLQRLELDWSEIPFIGLLVSFTSLNTLEVGGAYVPRPDITPEQELAVDAVLRAFGFEPVT